MTHFISIIYWINSKFAHYLAKLFIDYLSAIDACQVPPQVGTITTSGTPVICCVMITDAQCAEICPFWCLTCNRNNNKTFGIFGVGNMTGSVKSLAKDLEMFALLNTNITISVVSTTCSSRFTLQSSYYKCHNIDD